MKLYCQKCGSGTEYSFDKPKFCASCGNSFGASMPQQAQSRQRTIPAPRVTHNEDDEEGSERVPDINRLDFDIDIPQRKGSKIGNLVGTKDQSMLDERGQMGSPMSKEQLLEQFKKEAGFYPARQEINEED